MELLEKKIATDGEVLPGHVLKVGSFLNQQLDVSFLLKMGEEIARLYEKDGVTKILTIETSGIALAMAAAQYLHVPVVFAKKHKASNQGEALYRTSITSYTHQNTYEATVDKAYLSAGERILIVDDFLARGEALKGLIRILQEAEATLVGCAVGIEKGFQGGGDAIRACGIRVESLAIVEEMSEKGIVYRR